MGFCLKQFPKFFFGEMEIIEIMGSEFLLCIYLGLVSIILKQVALNLKGEYKGFNFTSTLIIFIIVVLASFLITNYLPSNLDFLDFFAIILPSLSLFSLDFNAKLTMGGPLGNKPPLEGPRVLYTKRPGSNDIPDLYGGEAEAGPSSKEGNTDSTGASNKKSFGNKFKRGRLNAFDTPVIDFVTPEGSRREKIVAILKHLAPHPSQDRFGTLGLDKEALQIIKEVALKHPGSPPYNTMRRRLLKLSEDTGNPKNITNDNTIRGFLAEEVEASKE